MTTASADLQIRIDINGTAATRTPEVAFSPHRFRVHICLIHQNLPDISVEYLLLHQRFLRSLQLKPHEVV